MDIGMERIARTYNDNMLIVYDCQTEKFNYPSNISKVFGVQFDSRALWQILKEEQIVSADIARQLEKKIKEFATSDGPNAYYAEYPLKIRDKAVSWYRVGMICSIPHTVVNITLTDIQEEVMVNQRLIQMAEYDELTGLLNLNAFDREVQSILYENGEQAAKGEYAFIYFDVIRFKAINDFFGMMEGDRLLIYIAQSTLKLMKPEDVACRLNADRFVVFTHTSGKELERMVERILANMAKYDLTFEISCNMGIYVTGEEQISVDSMIDRAALAQAAIKGSYSLKYNYYTEAMRNDMLTEQEVVGSMTTALAERQFLVYYQPQYDHSSGMLVGAEALVRWMHPEKGLISPGIFIPIFEKNGFITKLDLCVFEEVCLFIRKCMDKNLDVVPISTNFSRHDIFQPDFISRLEGIREKYEVPAKYLRVEITESAIVGSSQQANDIVRKLHECGYIVEMDDFGSGYSSLNVLKDIELDIIKLDMLFLSKETGNNRGGTIISSVVRMAKWLDMPIIAEGVESVEQADFLRSIGCNYIQGYLYSKPLPEESYEKLIDESTIGVKEAQMDLINNLDANNFWNPKSLETLIFSNYVGGASIFEYRNGQVEVLRVNKRYLTEFDNCVSEKDIIENEPMRFFDEKNKQIYIDMLDRAIETKEEQECETWRYMVSSCCEGTWLCIRTNVQMIGRIGETSLFYAMVRNVTTEKKQYAEMQNSERRFKMASEQANIYYWEYIIDKKEMYPCARCIRDLGMSPVMKNYPECAIEMGVFPPEVADMYREWHEQIAAGVKELEAVIPLTEDRIPYRVKYTTEFDESGKPVKAYGSATLIV